MINEPDYVAGTLAWCNEKRLEQDLPTLAKLPKGVPGDASSCPCGKATGYYVYTDAAYPPDVKDSVEEIPRAVTEFVLAFDAGELPQYDENSVEDSA